MLWSLAMRLCWPGALRQPPSPLTWPGLSSACLGSGAEAFASTLAVLSLCLWAARGGLLTASRSSETRGPSEPAPQLGRGLRGAGTHPGYATSAWPLPSPPLPSASSPSAEKGAPVWDCFLPLEGDDGPSALGPLSLCPLPSPAALQRPGTELDAAHHRGHARLQQEE